MKKFTQKYLRLNKTNVSKLDTQSINAILGGNAIPSRFTVDFEEGKSDDGNC